MLFYNKKILLIVTFFSIQESCCSEILKKYLTKNNVLLGTSMVALTYFAYKYFNKKNPPKNNHNKEDGLKQSPPKSPEEEKTSEAIPKFSPEKLNTNEKKPEASSECPSSELEKKDFKEEIFVKKNKNQTMITEKTTWKDLGITEQINNSDKELQARFFKKIENQLIERIEDTYPTKTPSIMSKQPDDSIEKFSRYLFNDFKKIIEAYNCINISYQENESIKNSSDLYYFIENKLFDALGNIALPCLDRYGQAINITPLETVNKTFNEFRKLVNKKNESSDKYETILAHCTIEKDAAKTSSMTQNEKEFIDTIISSNKIITNLQSFNKKLKNNYPVFLSLQHIFESAQPGDRIFLDFDGSIRKHYNHFDQSMTIWLSDECIQSFQTAQKRGVKIHGLTRANYNIDLQIKMFKKIGIEFSSLDECTCENIFEDSDTRTIKGGIIWGDVNNHSIRKACNLFKLLSFFKNDRIFIFDDTEKELAQLILLGIPENCYIYLINSYNYVANEISKTVYSKNVT